jgi:predicted phosphate transport protein (TIGR00153 family)
MRFNFLDLLLPRETKFYDLFIEHAGRLGACAKRLRELAAELEAAVGPSDAGAAPAGSEAARRDILKAGVAEVKEIEKQADKIEEKINVALEESFITPFDREDIHLIASAVDNAIDAVKALTTKLDIYGVLELPPRFGEFAEIVADCALSLSEAFERMKKRSSLSACVKAVSESEKKADLLFSIVIGDLFKSEKTAVEIIREKEVYEGLEEIVNNINVSAKLLRRVMIKQG